MSNRNFNASVITQRRANKAVAMNILSNMKSGNPYSFNAQTSNTETSIINQVNLGNSLDVSRGPTCTTIDPGCPCPNNINIVSIQPTGWLSFLSLSNPAVGGITAWNTTTYGDFVYGIAYSSSMITLYDTALNNTIPTTPLLTINSNTAQFGIVVCYNKAGAVQWVTKIDVTGTTNNNVFPQSITADDSGVYIVGYNSPFSGGSYNTINFYNGSLNNYTTTTPIDNSVVYNSTNSGNIFIVKYSYSGQVLWATKIEGTGIDRTFSIVNNNQNIYIAGSVVLSGASCNIFEALNNTAITTLTSTGGPYSFICAYNKSGILQSVTKNIGISSISSMVISNNDLFVFSSLTSLTLIIYNSNGTINPTIVLYVINQNSVYTNSTQSMVLIKYDISNPNITYSSSVLLKSFDVSLPSSSTASSLTFIDNKIVIVGWFIRTLYIFNSNSNISIADSIINSNSGTNFNTYIISFDNNLNYILSDKIDSLTDNRAYTITSDNNNIYIGGFISGTAIFPSNTEPDISLTSIGGNEAVIYSYNTSNNLNWITTWRSSSFENCLGLSADNNGNLFISGYVTGGSTTDFYSTDLSTKLPKTTPSFSFSSVNRSPIFMKYTTNGQI